MAEAEPWSTCIDVLTICSWKWVPSSTATSCIDSPKSSCWLRYDDDDVLLPFLPYWSRFDAFSMEASKLLQACCKLLSMFCSALAFSSSSDDRFYFCCSVDKIFLFHSYNPLRSHWKLSATRARAHVVRRVQSPCYLRKLHVPFNVFFVCAKSWGLVLPRAYA